MNDLPKSQQPRSDDPEFWDVWTGKEKREINWETIAEDWQGGFQNLKKDLKNTGERDETTPEVDVSTDEHADDIPF